MGGVQSPRPWPWTGSPVSLERLVEIQVTVLTLMTTSVFEKDELELFVEENSPVGSVVRGFEPATSTKAPTPDHVPDCGRQRARGLPAGPAERGPAGPDGAGLEVRRSTCWWCRPRRRPW